MTAGRCAFHPDGDPGCHICQVASHYAAPVETPEVDRTPEWYCPTCARPRGNKGCADECVCLGTDVAATEAELPAPVQVPEGTRAALERYATAARAFGLLNIAHHAILTTPDVQAARRRLVFRGPRTPLAVDVALSQRGWTVTAARPAGQLSLMDDGPPGRGFRAELPACECDARMICTHPRCQKSYGRDGHCHGTGRRHAEHVEDFARRIAADHHGPVTVSPVPRRPAFARVGGAR